MAWQTPKTDWYGFVDGNGVYQGDRFNASDFNRIKNNLETLRTIAIKITENFSINQVETKAVGDYFYADEINALQENLDLINEKTFQLNYGESVEFKENERTMTFNDLNRLESATLELYEMISNKLNGFRMFTWNFGFKGGEL